MSDKLRELVAKWRKQRPKGSMSWDCADELEAALAAPEPAMTRDISECDLDGHGDSGHVHTIAEERLSSAMIIKFDAKTGSTHMTDREQWGELMAKQINNKYALAGAASVGAGGPDNYFTRLNANIRNAEQFAADVEFIHACHIEGAITGACRQVFERRERAAFEAGRARTNGHEFTPSNTLFVQGGRRCLTCKRAMSRAWSRGRRQRLRAALHPGAVQSQNVSPRVRGALTLSGFEKCASQP